MSRSNDGYPDSRDPSPPYRRLIRIVSAAEQIQERADVEDLRQLAALVIELAEIVKEVRPEE